MKTISLEQAVAMIPDGASLMIGGFVAVGTPERVMDEIVRQGKRNLTVIANDTGTPEKGIGKLIVAKLVRKLIASHGFAVSHLTHHMRDRGKQFEYRMTLHGRDPKNAEALSRHLRTLPGVIEFRISPTGD